MGTLQDVHIKFRFVVIHMESGTTRLTRVPILSHWHLSSKGTAMPSESKVKRSVSQSPQ